MQTILISASKQSLLLRENNQQIAEYSISTSKYGLGEANGSYQTPRGRHTVRAMIGEELPLNAVLVGRRYTGEIYTADLSEQFPKRDWVLTRIIWLSGCEKGINRLGQRDSMRRYIYIHGTPDSEPMGVPASHGCIRMRNVEVIDLYNRISHGCAVIISD
ncbi:MAG: L,D-transpeptidase [Pseudomonadales bacterium]|nr:L,D-transpeptidase [Pseudomonadales bacterium]